VHGEDGRDVEMEGLVFLRVAGGRIAEEWANWDYLDLAQQLGVELELTPPA
jgi:predicted ester cyclase